MTARDFCYWLQGFLEITDASTIDEKQLGMIRKHLNMVFAQDIDPTHGDKTKQDKLNQIHSSSDIKYRC
jgi:hypothetical protein